MTLLENFPEFPAYLSVDYLSVIPSYSCARKCYYCYNVPLGQNTETDHARLLNRLGEFAETNDCKFVAEVLGGEPLDRENIAVTTDILKKLGEIKSCRRVALSTAVTSLSRLMSIVSLIDFLYLSTDISKSNQNVKRISVACLKKIVDLCNINNVDLCLSVVLDGSEKAGELNEFVAYACDIGIKQIGFGYISHYSISDGVISNYIEIFYCLFVLKTLYADKLFLGGDVLETLDGSVTHARRSSVCNCGDRSLVIEPDGSVTPSNCLVQNCVQIISPSEYVHYKQERANALHSGWCAGCDLWSACRGGCMGTAANVRGNFNDPHYTYCKILLGTWKYISEDMRSIR